MKFALFSIPSIKLVYRKPFLLIFRTNVHIGTDAKWNGNQLLWFLFFFLSSSECKPEPFGVGCGEFDFNFICRNQSFSRSILKCMSTTRELQSTGFISKPITFPNSLTIYKKFLFLYTKCRSNRMFCAHQLRKNHFKIIHFIINLHISQSDRTPYLLVLFMLCRFFLWQSHWIMRFFSLLLERKKKKS